MSGSEFEKGAFGELMAEFRSRHPGESIDFHWDAQRPPGSGDAWAARAIGCTGKGRTGEEAFRALLTTAKAAE